VLNCFDLFKEQPNYILLLEELILHDLDQIEPINFTVT